MSPEEKEEYRQQLFNKFKKNHLILMTVEELSVEDYLDFDCNLSYCIYPINEEVWKIINQYLCYCYFFTENYDNGGIPDFFSIL